MLDTIRPGDVVTIDRGAYANGDPPRGDIIMFTPPQIALLPNQMDENGNAKVNYLKRVIGIPGDVVEVKKSVLYVNGQKFPEPYVRGSMAEDFKLVLKNGQVWPLTISGDRVNDTPKFTAAPFLVDDYGTMQKLLSLPSAKIPTGKYLVMGDNRNDSYDSRAFGLIDRSVILGKAILK